MSGKQIHLYATYRELLALLEAVGACERISYAEAGLFENGSISVVSDSTKLEAFKTYIAFFRTDSVLVRPVPQVRGTMKYAVDQLENPNTIAIHLGGEHSRMLLLASHIGTVSASKDSATLFRLHVHEVRKRFRRIKSFWVGPQAESLLDQKWRLASTAKSHPEYDLVR